VTPDLGVSPVRRLLGIYRMSPQIHMEQRNRFHRVRLLRSRLLRSLPSPTHMPSVDSYEVEERLDLILPDLDGLALGEPVNSPAFVPTLHQLTTERDRTLRVQCIESPGYVGESSVSDAFFSRISR
jgi:hypothetical protein